jgi:hypothetical protein
MPTKTMYTTAPPRIDTSVSDGSARRRISRTALAMNTIEMRMFERLVK